MEDRTRLGPEACLKVTLLNDLAGLFLAVKYKNGFKTFVLLLLLIKKYMFVFILMFNNLSLFTGLLLGGQNNSLLIS